MKLTAQIEYAYWALLDIAERFSPDFPINLNEISQRNGIPEKYLLQVMLKLKKQGIVTSRRGSGGGFQLTRSPEDIRFAEVVEVLSDGLEPATSRCFTKGDCALPDIWAQANQAFYKELRQFNLKQLLQKEKRLRGKNATRQVKAV